MANGMDKKSKYLLWVFFVIVIIVAAISFRKYFILKDYLIKAQADCDPATEKCFMITCDPTTDDQCPKDPAEQTSYYKYVEKKASTIPSCDPNSPDCPALECTDKEDCKEILCDDSTKNEDETCNDPAEYNKNNPEETTDNSSESPSESSDSSSDSENN